MSQGTSYGLAGGRSAREFLREVLVTGTAIVVPVLVTAVVLLILVDVLSGLLDPLVIPIREGLGTSGGEAILPKVVATAVLLGTIVVVGAIDESGVAGNRLKDGLDSTMAHIPGVGAIYGPLERISEMMLEGDTDNFQEVVLVEYPEEGSYSVAFKTAEPPEQVRAAVDGHDDMITVFMPMGPNPFMGGFIMYVEPEQVYDVDLTVEEGITAIVSFGVAVDAADHGDDGPAEAIDQLDRQRSDA